MKNIRRMNESMESNHIYALVDNLTKKSTGLPRFVVANNREGLDDTLVYFLSERDYEEISDWIIQSGYGSSLSEVYDEYEIEDGLVIY